jgi:hypothetical protein
MLNDQHIVNNDDEKFVDDDWDSQDSNREDHDDFEYPDNADGESENDSSENEKIHDDNEEYVEKHQKLKNSIFDKILKNNKNWAHLNHKA